ncbi:MAG: tyrosine-type recombinase/integrase [Thermacetogeniaceae bacterium]
MRGHIRKRAKDSWTVVVELPRDPVTGKRRQKWVTVKGTKKDAERRLAELITEVERGEVYFEAEKLTLGEYLERYLEAIRHTKRESTCRGYETAFKAFKGIHHIPLAKLSPMTVQEAVTKMLSEKKPRTVGDYLLRLKVALNQAVAWGLIPKSPASGVKLPKGEEREMRVWNEEEARQFLAYAKEKCRYYPLFALALATGARLGELLALRWEDVDLEEGVIYIKRTVSGRKGYASPKTAAGRRKVPIDGDTVKILKEHRIAQLKEKLMKGAGYNPEDLVFTTANGKRVAYSTVEASLASAAEKVGVPRIRFHDLRHTHATILLRQGVHPKVVQERLGHKSIKTTLDIYSHVLPDTQKEAVRVVERILKGSRQRR